MKRFKIYLAFAFLAVVCLNSVRAKKNSDSDSGSGSDSNESGDGNKVKNRLNTSLLPQIVQPYGYPYNHPVYMSPVWQPPFADYNLPPMSRGYARPRLPPVAFQHEYDPYSYGGYYNQPESPVQATLYSAGPARGTNSINHSLKINKEYNEVGHHHGTDSS